MSTVTAPFRMPKPVSRKVWRLRWLVRLYVLLNGLAKLGMVFGLAFWIGLALDWTFEPSQEIRVALWIVTGLIAAFVAAKHLLGPLAAKLSNTNLALLLERNFSDLNQSVITTVEAADRRRHSPIGNQRLLASTSETAADTLSSKRLSEVFQFRPLIRNAGLAIALAASILIFAISQTEAFGFWMQRMKLSEQPWPRRVELSVAGFLDDEGTQTVNVARDDDFQLDVLASILDGHEAPEQVEIRYRDAEGRRRRFPLTRIGKAVPGRDEAQLFRYEFKKVASDLSFDLVGGDDRLRGLQLRVVERPQIYRVALECQFPGYLNRTPQTIPVSGRIELPEGTSAICRITANKSLQSVSVHDPAEQVDLPAQLLEENDQEASFQLDIGQTDRVLLVTMHDTDGVENREPYRLVFSAIPDQPPEVSVQLRAIGSAVTPQARIPFAGMITDEYGLESARFEYQVDETPPQSQPLENQPSGRREIRELGDFDLAITDPATNRPRVELKPGQQLTLAIKATDAYDLQDQGHTGSSQRFMLDVVTNSELRALLEKKELALRQRFESIYEKMTGTRELLDRIDAKPNDNNNPEDDSNQERLRERDRLRVSGALQNVVQLSHETLGVADGIEDIVGELVNNRVDSEELTERLQQGIANPLREIGAQLMPRLEAEMQALQTAMRDQQSPREPLSVSKVRGDEVLDAMKRVLDRMLELESYNELVELLRGIIADQQQLQEETKQQRRAKLRSLLDD